MPNITVSVPLPQNIPLGSESGSAFVEFTLILPVLVLLLLGVADFGLALQQAIVSADAAHAATLWATQPGVTPTNSGLLGAVNALRDAQVTVDSANLLYACSATGTKTTTVPSCTTGSPMTWAQVTTHINLPALFGYSGLPTSFTLNGSSTIRVR